MTRQTIDLRDYSITPRGVHPRNTRQWLLDLAQEITCVLASREPIYQDAPGNRIGEMTMGR